MYELVREHQSLHESNAHAFSCSSTGDKLALSRALGILYKGKKDQVCMDINNTT